MSDTVKDGNAEAQRHWAEIAARPPNIEQAYYEANGRLVLASLRIFNEVAGDLNSRSLARRDALLSRKEGGQS